MAFDKKIYYGWDFKDLDEDMIPSLDLPDINIDKCSVPKDGRKYMVFYVSVKMDTRPSSCPVCRRENAMNSDGNGKARLLHDVSRNNYRVDIVLLPKRFECKYCNAKITPTLRGIEENRQMTTRLLEYLQTECFLQSHTALAERSGFTPETIQNIMDAEIEKCEANRKLHPVEAPRVLGIDEKHIDKVMCGTFVDVETGRLLDMVDNNKAETMKGAIRKLKNWETNIEVVTTDMNNAYLRWLPNFLPNATMVVDKFHVMQDIHRKVKATKSKLYEYRKGLIKQIENPEEKARQNTILQMLNSDKRLFDYGLDNIVRDENSDKALKLLTVMEEFQEFRLLRKLLYFAELMYQQENVEDATAAWNEWIGCLPPLKKKEYTEWCELYSVPPLFDEFQSLLRPGFQFFKTYILNYFRPGCRHTNAATEGVNTLIERINRDGNGLKFKSLRAKSLYASLIHERKQYGIDMKTIEVWKPKEHMMSSWGFGQEELVRKNEYEFTEITNVFNLSPTNVFADNNDLLDILTMRIVDKQMDVIEIDEETIIGRAQKFWGPFRFYFDDEDED